MIGKRWVMSLSTVACFARHLGADCNFQATMRLAEGLTLQQRHHEAELEYERLAAACEKSSEKSAAIARMVDSALATRDFSFSLKLSRAWMARAVPPDSCTLMMGETKSLYGMENNEAVIRQALPVLCRPNFEKEMGYITGLSLLRLQKWPQASEQFSRLRQSDPDYPHANEAQSIADRGRHINWKSPRVAAGWSAVIPGSGYLYARRPQTAVAAFLITGLFIGGTYASAHAGEPGLAALLGLFSAGWYFGGVRGSALAARHTNDHEMQKLIEPIDILR